MVERMAIVPDDTLVAVEDGRVVGQCTPRVDTLTVHPEFRRRGHGRRLVEAARRRSSAARASTSCRCGATVTGPRRPGSSTPSAPSTARACGCSSCPPERAVPPPVFPAEVRRPADPRAGRRSGATSTSSTASSRTIPRRCRGPRRTSARSTRRPDFDPSSVLIVAPATEPDRLSAVCRTLELPGDDGRQRGEIGIVGLLPEWRGRGLGRQLLRWGVEHLRAAGYDEIELSVEARNAPARSSSTAGKASRPPSSGRTGSLPAS